MVNWGEVKNKIIENFNNTPSTIEESAEQQADILVNDVLLKSSDLYGNTTFVNNVNTFANGIKGMFLLLFQTNINSPVDLLVVPYITFATAFVPYILTNIKLTFTIPHLPATAPQSVPNPNVITFPGEPTSFGTLLYNSFNSGNNKLDRNANANLFATSLVATYTTYLSTISGNYLGLVPSLTGPVPTVIPWVGLK